MQQLRSLELIGQEGDQNLDTIFGTLSDQRAISSTIKQSQSIRVHASDTFAPKCCSHDAGGAFGADHSCQQSSGDMSESGPPALQSLQSSSSNDHSHTEDPPRVQAVSDSSHVSTVVRSTSPPPTQMKRRVRSEQEIQEMKRLAQKKLKLFEGMRPKQKQALQFLERSSSSAFILLPTGSGKTHLIWTHKKEQECAVIFVPYRILGSQLQCVLESHGLTVTWPFQSYSGSIDAMLCNVHFAILPYEAAPEAVGFITSLNSVGRLGPIWVDEVCSAKPEFVIRS
jgi:hypothetical protein